MTTEETKCPMCALQGRDEPAQVAGNFVNSNKQPQQVMHCLEGHAWTSPATAESAPPLPPNVLRLVPPKTPKGRAINHEMCVAKVRELLNDLEKGNLSMRTIIMIGVANDETAIMRHTPTNFAAEQLRVMGLLSIMSQRTFNTIKFG